MAIVSNIQPSTIGSSKVIFKITIFHCCIQWIDWIYGKSTPSTPPREEELLKQLSGAMYVGQWVAAIVTKHTVWHASTWPRQCFLLMIAKWKATCMPSVWLELGHRHRTIVFKGTVSHCYCWTVIDVHSSLGEVPEIDRDLSMSRNGELQVRCLRSLHNNYVSM